MSSFLFIPAIFAGMLLLLIATGLLISVYWKWFIIPIFSVKPITIPQSLGLSLFISLFTPNIKSIDQNPMESLPSFLSQFAFYLVAGYILQFFIKNKYNK